MALELIPAILGAAAIFIAAYALATPASRARCKPDSTDWATARA